MASALDPVQCRLGNGVARATGSAFEDEVFAEDEVDEERDDDIRSESDCGHDAEVMDEKAHDGAAEGEADAGDEVEEEDFVDAVVAAGFEDPENVDQVSGEVREQEGDAVVDDGIAGADGIGHETDLDVKQFGDGVGGGEGRHEFERTAVEQADVDDGGDAAGDGVLDELDERGVLAAGELAQQVPHVALPPDEWVWFVCDSVMASIWRKQVLD